MQRKDGSLFWAETKRTPVKDSAGTVSGTVSAITDITERKSFEHKLTQQANFDPLTELPNRRCFLERLEAAVSARRKQGRRVAVVLIDLDNFKLVNDSLGHDAGDQMLRLAGKRLQSCVRAGDTVARLSGDAFTLILANVVDEKDALQVTDRARRTLTEPAGIAGRDIRIAASFGIAVATGSETTAADLLQYAEIAMFESKSRGNSASTLFSGEMREKMIERLERELVSSPN